MFLLPFIFYLVEATLIPELNRNFQEDLAKFSANFFLQNCNECKTILIIHSTEDPSANYFLKEVSRKNSYKSGIYTIKLDNFTGTQENSPALYKQDVTIIFLNENNWHNVEEVLFSIEVETYWNIRAKFLGLYHYHINLSKYLSPKNHFPFPQK